MFRGLRAVGRLAGALLQGLWGVVLVLVVFPRAARATRHGHVQRWSAGMLRRLGLQLQVEGQFKAGVKLVVANHISWIDILCVHAVCPQARFVSKADVQSWPLVGRLVDAGDTLYIQRESRRDALRVVHQMADALKAGDTVAVFPEGTTGEGTPLLPFHANLLQAAIAVEAPIQPVALRYGDAQARFSPAAQWLGDTTLLGTLWKLAKAERLVAHVRVLSPLGTAHADRRSLAAHVRSQIEEALV
ncbi:MAG: lysophospholipid acyltransferase family protein [Rubrivivax sp.]|jgi:1-acyl-sn-glycerol-3-phosphate acyltransferase